MKIAHVVKGQISDLDLMKRNYKTNQSEVDEETDVPFFHPKIRVRSDLLSAQTGVEASVSGNRDATSTAL